MKSKLLQSFFFITGFWWTVLFILFSLEPSLTEQALIRLGLHPAAHISALNHLKYWIDLLQAWTIPMFGWLLASLALGVLITGGSAIRTVLERKDREKNKGEYRGINLTLGEFPEPVMLKSVPLKDLSASGGFGEKLKSMTPEQLELLKQIFSVIAAYPEAYPGDGHGVTLLQHTINVVEKIMSEPDSLPLAAVAAADHDIGKITAFKKDGDEWKRVKLHDKESGKWLALLPAWWKLPEDERNALVLAVKYDHSRGALPTLNDDGRAAALAMRILEQVSQADSEATKEEKQRVLDAREVDALVFQAFVDELPRLTWQDMGLPPGVKAVGWKLGSRLYFLESQLRERCLAVLDPDLTAALGGFYREKGKIAPFSIALMKVLNDQGWLVKQIGKIKVPDEMPLWKIRAGTKEFSAIIAVDVPEDMLDRLPQKDTSYQLEVAGPHIAQPGSMSTTDISLDGVLTSSGKKTRPKVEKIKGESSKPEAQADAQAADPMRDSDNLGLFKPKASAQKPAEPAQLPEPTANQDGARGEKGQPALISEAAGAAEPVTAATPSADGEAEKAAKPEEVCMDSLIPGMDELLGSQSETSLKAGGAPEVVKTDESLNEPLNSEAPHSPDLKVAPEEAAGIAPVKEENAESRTSPPTAAVPDEKREGKRPGQKPESAVKAKPAEQKSSSKSGWLDSSIYRDKPDNKKNERSDKKTEDRASAPEKSGQKNDGKPKTQQGKDKGSKGGFVDGLW